jgi:hypothetical protein
MGTKHNNKRQEPYTYKDYDKYEAEREKLQAEINGDAKGWDYQPKVKSIEPEVFSKTEAERAKLKDLKKINKIYLKKAGLDPKKWMNDPNSNMGVVKR